MLYAKHAQQNGNTELANLFKTAANVERFQHFAEEAQLAGLVGGSADNLKDAIKGESYEVETMYRQFGAGSVGGRQSGCGPLDSNLCSKSVSRNGRGMTRAELGNALFGVSRDKS